MARHKRYFLMYESDQIICRSHDHEYAGGNSVKTCRQYIRNIRRDESQYNPRNFRIYDTFEDVDPETGFVPVVYQED